MEKKPLQVRQYIFAHIIYSYNVPSVFTISKLSKLNSTFQNATLLIWQVKYFYLKSCIPEATAFLQPFLISPRTSTASSPTPSSLLTLSDTSFLLLSCHSSLSLSARLNASIDQSTELLGRLTSKGSFNGRVILMKTPRGHS